MTLLRALISLVLISSTALALNTTNEAIPNFKPDKYCKPLDVRSNKMIYAKKGEQLQISAGFVLIDTLFNAYSYFNNTQQPFIYNPATSELITIHRGSLETNLAPNYDSKDNLFIRTSKDWGANWEEPILVYNMKDNKNHAARYPSVYPVEFEGSNSYVYSAPTTKGDGWTGVVTGLYYTQESAIVTDFKESFNINSQDYGYFTNGKIMATTVDGGYYGLAVSGALPFGGNPWNLNSNIAARTSTDLVEWQTDLPAAWSTDLFTTVTQDSASSVSLVDMIYNPDGKIYVAVVARFKADQAEYDQFVPAVSIAQSPGAEFSSLEDLRMPYSLVTDYFTPKVAIPDSVGFTGAEAFNMFDDGEFSFIGRFTDSDTNKPENNRLMEFVEINYKNNQWAIRPIARTSGYVARYFDNPTNGTQTNNQLAYETQLSKTLDNNYLVLKWVDFPIINNEMDNTSTDVFISVRHKDSTKWSDPINLTQTNAFSGEPTIDHITWIPNILPSNFSSLPLIELEQIPIEGATNAVFVEVPQFLLFAKNDNLNIPSRIKYDGTSSVNDTKNGLTVSLSPNPANYDTYINIALDKNAELNIELFDVMGQRLNSIYNGYTDAGNKSYRVKTSDLAAGVYYAVVTVNGNKYSQIINVLH